ncbi:hypothetical protein D7B24_009513 [Verticillium nonalfalfae]|uniref:diphosphoinositol-polyphosphate diphosphatase n=1 Tax=Verticillium nonalfalfae TaxID=1051616 RepID=A0A3M9Y6B2_9PEZI|nr:uncharacterized protein D7B24_009513 [Verticillium nonalfalfae]RNJ54690.1 hypothetical protein D7B24_009513 [Verticillium nonalfalfae]
MASKRSARTFEGDGHHVTENETRWAHTRTKEEDAAAKDTLEKRSNYKTLSRRGSDESSHPLDTAVETSKNMTGVTCESAVQDLEAQCELSRCVRHSAHADLRPALPLVPTDLAFKRHVPEKGRPVNFGIVVPGVYRSSYPKPEDFGFVKNLGLRTIVTLGRKDEPDEFYANFLASNSIRHHVIEMKGTKKQSIPLMTMRDILRIVLDKQQYPLMIHCNHGKHRTGCVVAVVRKLSGWDVSNVLDEYRSFAEPKVRDCDIAYITNFAVDDLSNLHVHAASMRYRVRNFFRATVFAFCVLVLWTVSGSRISTSARNVTPLK